MIISHKHKFIFIKTHKTAGSSIEMALANLCGADDIITPLYGPDEKERIKLGFTTAQNYFIPFSEYSVIDLLRFVYNRRKLRFRSHSTPLKIKKHIPKEIWNSYYKFCFERNPYEKIVSWYHWRNNGRTNYDLNTYLEKRLFQIEAELDRYYIKNQFVVDKIYAYEKLPEALADLTEKFELKEPLKLPEYRAKGNIRKDRRHYTEVLTQQQMDLIYDIFKPIFKILNYKRERSLVKD